MVLRAVAADIPDAPGEGTVVQIGVSLSSKSEDLGLLAPVALHQSCLSLWYPPPYLNSEDIQLSYIRGGDLGKLQRNNRDE